MFGGALEDPQESSSNGKSAELQPRTSVAKQKTKATLVIRIGAPLGAAHPFECCTGRSSCNEGSTASQITKLSAKGFAKASMKRA
jgi:hypothetical protein